MTIEELRRRMEPARRWTIEGDIAASAINLAAELEARIELFKNDVDATDARIASLEEERDRLKRELTFAQANNRTRNIELDALHYVWCDGGCKGGVHRFGEHPPLTAEIVAAAKRNTRRLESWYVDAKGHEAEPTREARQPIWSGSFCWGFEAFWAVIDHQMPHCRGGLWRSAPHTAGS